MSSRWWLRVGLNSGIRQGQAEGMLGDSEACARMVKVRATLL
jgi:hypothetical protein